MTKDRIVEAIKQLEGMERVRKLTKAGAKHLQELRKGIDS